jgi:protein SCO1/2
VTNPPKHPRRKLLAALTGLALLSGLGPLAGCDAPTPPPAAHFKAVDISGADYADQLELPDASGKRRNLSEFKGKIAVVFFGYTQCPDVCPTTLTDLVETQRLLGADGDKLVAILVTVDPERDSAELLKSYVGNFNPSWVALRGNAEETAAAAKRFKVFYRKAPGRTADSYTVDHTAASYVFDTSGRIRLYVRNGTPPADMAADIKTLLAQKG